LSRSEASSRRGAVAALVCAAGGLALSVSTPAPAKAASAATTSRFDIPAQPLGQALNQLALQSNREILFSPGLTAGRRSPILKGVFTPEEALARLLSGSGLAVRLEGRSFLVQAALPAPSPARPAPSPPPPPPPDIDTPLESVVVTALKRSTQLQKTPVSMTVLTGEQLSRLGMVDLERAAPLLPGLKLVTTPFGRRLVLRGVYGAGEATTGLYYDETPMTGPVGTTADPGQMTPELALVDVDRIELLRGPQGTLYGAGSMGGALRVLFKRPDLARDAGFVSVNAASVAHGEQAGGFTAALNRVIVPDVLAARLTVYDQRTPGAIDNIRLGLSDVDSTRTRGVRLGVRWEPTARLSLLLSGTTQTGHRDDISAWHDTAGPWLTRHAARAPFDGKIGLANATLHWKGDAVDVTATSSWYRWKLIRRSDYSGVLLGERDNPAGCARYFSLGGTCDAGQMQGYTAYVDSLYPAILHQPINLTSWIQEIRASSTREGPVGWTVGAYHEIRDDLIDSQVPHVDPLTGVVQQPVILIGRRSIDNHVRQEAVFGEVSYDPRPETRLTLGARWFDYAKRDRGEVQIPNVVSGTWAGYRIDARTQEEGWSLKALASQQITPDILGYVQMSQGFRPGGVNVVPGLADSLAPYRSDRLTNYEAGLKSQFADRRFTANLALYQIDWRDMQYSAQTQNRAFSFLTNIGASRIRGVEGEFTARRLWGWDAAASATFTDARLTADQITNTAIGLGLKGDRLPVVPRFASAASLERQWPLTDRLEGRFRIDVAYTGTSRSAFNRGNADYLKMGGYATFGVSFGVKQDDWRADLAIDNLLDRAGRASAQRNTSGPIDYFGIAPRTLRVTVERRL
jgi:outer membrane receptor protein involved in Fe transport